MTVPVTTQDLQRYVDHKLLVDVASEPHAVTGVMTYDETIVTAHIASAYASVLAVLLPATSAIQRTESAALITKWTCILAAVSLVGRRGKVPDGLARLGAQVEQQLDQVRLGRMSLGSTSQDIFCLIPNYHELTRTIDYYQSGQFDGLPEGNLDT